MTAAESRHVALLRGINVGGKHRLAMADLVKVFVEQGCRDVGTYIQSGNVCFRATATAIRSASKSIEGAIRERFGYEVPVILRSFAELDCAVRENPFLKTDAAPGRFHVAFLKDRPAPARVAALDPDRSPGDEFRVVGRDVFLHLPQGVGKTKLSNAYLDRTLATTSTVRNWRTVLELHRRLSTIG